MKHILITGGNDGLGKVIAKHLLKNGYSVTILGRDELRTKQTADELKCAFVVGDVSEPDSVTKALVQAEKDNPIDILINNAGVWIQGALEDNDPKRINKAMAVNALGPIYCSRYVIPGMKKRGQGKIININSQGGFYAKAERSVYTASKWALTGFTKALYLELKPFNIAVTGIYPGAMKNTEIFAKAGNDRDMSKAMDPNQVADAVVYACSLPDGVAISELGVESLSY